MNSGQTEPSKVNHPADLAWPFFPPWLLATLLALATVALYWPATTFDFLNYDDPAYVSANPRVEAGLKWRNLGWACTTIVVDNWHPVTVLSLMLDASVFGPGAYGFHLTNILFHAANVALLFWLLHSLTGARWRGALVAALFGWHPLHVESVAWISERKDVLSTFFGFLALIFYARYAQGRRAGGGESREPGAAGGGNRGNHSSFFILHASFSYWLSFLCLALGLLSKPMLVTWPFVMLLLDFWPLGRTPSFQPSAFSLQAFRAGWPLVREKIPFLALALAVALVTFAVQKHAHAVIALGVMPPGMRVANAFVAYNRYLEKLYWPENLAVFYPHPGYWPGTILAMAVLALGVVSGLSCWQRRRHPWWLAGWLWFLVTLLPVIGLVQVGGQSMADRYSYVPSVGALVFSVWGVVALTRRWRRRGTMLVLASSLALGACLLLTRRQLEYWRNSEALFRHALDVTTFNALAHNNLGSALLARGEAEEAIQQFQTAISLQPDYADPRSNLGIALIHTGHAAEAAKQFEAAIRLRPDDPNFYDNLARTLGHQGETGLAIKAYQALLRLKPDSPEACRALGDLLVRQGRITEAILQFQAALRLNPGDAEARASLQAALSLRHSDTNQEPLGDETTK